MAAWAVFELEKDEDELLDTLHKLSHLAHAN